MTHVQLLTTLSFWLVFKEWVPLGLNKHVKLIIE